MFNPYPPPSLLHCVCTVVAATPHATAVRESFPWVWWYRRIIPTPPATTVEAAGKRAAVQPEEGHRQEETKGGEKSTRNKGNFWVASAKEGPPHAEGLGA